MELETSLDSDCLGEILVEIDVTWLPLLEEYQVHSVILTIKETGQVIDESLLASTDAGKLEDAINDVCDRNVNAMAQWAAEAQADRLYESWKYDE